MGSEKQTWKTLKKYLDQVEGIHYQRFEDAFSVGIPDLMVCKNSNVVFVELKQLDAFPKRSTTCVRLDFRANQFAWMLWHCKAGGRVALLAQIGREYFLTDFTPNLQKISDECLDEKRFRFLIRSYPTARDVVTKLLNWLGDS